MHWSFITFDYNCVVILQHPEHETHTSRTISEAPVRDCENAVAMPSMSPDPSYRSLARTPAMMWAALWSTQQKWRMCSEASKHNHSCDWMTSPRGSLRVMTTPHTNYDFGVWPCQTVLSETEHNPTLFGNNFHLVATCIRVALCKQSHSAFWRSRNRSPSWPHLSIL